MLKKLLLWALALVALFICVVLILSRLGYGGLRLSDGTYLGYSMVGEEWLLGEYQNYPVRQDGPYVFYRNGRLEALYVEGQGEVDTHNTNIQAAILRTENLGSQLNVFVDNPEKTTFSLNLEQGLTQASYARSSLVYPKSERLLAISDIEGNFDALTALLFRAGAIDGQFNWTYGDGQVVFIGDMVDRGDNVVPVLWLIYKLEHQAEQAGGQVHYVLGNHERYLIDGRMKSAARKYHGSARVSSMSPVELWSDSTVLGAWIRSKPVMIKIGETLFSHGGVSPKILNMKVSLADIDKEAAEGLSLGTSNVRTNKDSAIHSSNGILFYRGFVKDMTQHGLGAKASQDHVEEVLSFYDASQIAIGHTLVEQISFDYDKKLIRVDVDHAGGSSEALLFENDTWLRLDSSGEKHPLESF